jgi:hypothetical protein
MNTVVHNEQDPLTEKKRISVTTVLNSLTNLVAEPQGLPRKNTPLDTVLNEFHPLPFVKHVSLKYFSVI